ncbi:MAG: ribbon-helix-helix domain-containing protein [Dolichospermum sp.]|jgi:hypothetical protein
MATKKPRVTIYLNPDVKEILDNWALSENRTVTNLIETILKDVIQSRLNKDNTTE